MPWLGPFWLGLVADLPLTGETFDAERSIWNTSVDVGSY